MTTEYETWHDNLCVLDMLAGWGTFQSNLAIEIVYGVGSAPTTNVMQIRHVCLKVTPHLKQNLYFIFEVWTSECDCALSKPKIKATNHMRHKVQNKNTRANCSGDVTRV